MSRRPNAIAVRREKDHANIQADIVGDASDTCPKPATVSSNEKLSAIWDSVIGTGMAFRRQDAPLLEQFVFNMALAEDCRAHLFKEDGTPLLFTTGYDENGNEVYIDNPYYKKMREISADTLRLANELGMTPVARARLGLTKASTNAVNLSIAETIYKAMERENV
jgi:hypothetical protein